MKSLVLIVVKLLLQVCNTEKAISDWIYPYSEKSIKS